METKDLIDMLIFEAKDHSIKSQRRLGCNNALFFEINGVKTVLSDIELMSNTEMVLQGYVLEYIKIKIQEKYPTTNEYVCKTKIVNTTK